MPSRRSKAVCVAAALFGMSALGGVAAPAPADSEPETVEAKREAWWADLEKGEAVATRAVLKLSAAPDDAVAFLALKLKPLKIDEERVRELIGMLGSEKEEVWKTTFEYLEYFDPRLAIELPTLLNDVTATPARQRLVEVLSGRPAGSLGVKPVNLRGVGADGFNFSSENGSWWAEHKVSRLNSYGGWGNPKKKWTRAVRAIVLLEHIGSPDAVGVLKDMATGHPDAEPTKAAAEALTRVADGKSR